MLKGACWLLLIVVIYANYDFSSACYHQLNQINRNFNGQANGYQENRKGAVNNVLISQIPRHAPKSDDLLSGLPNPRMVSNQVADIPSFLESSSRFSFLLTIFGQFMDHDLSLTINQKDSSAQKIKIPIPKCDPNFDKICDGKAFLQFVRSKFKGESCSRSFQNQLTAWVDASMIYGVNTKDNQALREGSKDGKLAVSSDKKFQLPIKQKNSQLFLSTGDARFNQNVLLTSMHVIFFRQHNRIAQGLKAAHKNLSDQDIFNIARNYVIGLVQKITYEDFLPLVLGQKAHIQTIGPYKGLNPKANPNIRDEFSTAGFRFGHSLLKSQVLQKDNNGKTINKFEIKNLFFNPKLITQTSVGEFLKGAAQTPGKIKTAQITSAVRNFLITTPQGQMKEDLVTLNIMRGRDHGLGSYNDFRVAYGLNRIKKFEEMTDKNTAKKLQLVYKNPDNLELWVGIVAENSLPSAVLGPLGARIVGNQFKQIRDADNYWYELAYPKEIIQQIKQTTLSDIIRRNSQISNISNNVFLAQDNSFPCSINKKCDFSKKIQSQQLDKKLTNLLNLNKKPQKPTKP